MLGKIVMLTRMAMRLSSVTPIIFVKNVILTTSTVICKPVVYNNIAYFQWKWKLKFIVEFRGEAVTTGSPPATTVSVVIIGNLTVV